MIISGLYAFLFFMSLIATYLLLVKGRKMKLNYYAALFVSITVVCLAYFSYSVSIDKQTALVSNQFTYIDGTFMLLFFILCIMDLCKIKISRIFTAGMGFACLFFLALAFSAGHTDIFYKSYEYTRDYGASHLLTELGSLYPLYYLFVIINMLIPIGIIIYSTIRKKRISYKTIAALSFLLVCIVAMYFVSAFFEVRFDILPIGYVVIEYVILVIIQRLSLYDVANIAQRTAEEGNEYGYILFDTNRRFMGCNRTASLLFPELDNLLIDRKVTDDFCKKEFSDWIDVYIEGNQSKKVFERNSRKLIVSIREYKKENDQKTFGYLLEIRDDTEQQQLIEQLNDMNDKLEEAVQRADSANEAKSMFLANMSHEIRTPINAIMGMNQIAMNECSDQNVLEYLRDIEDASHNLLSIINDILDLSKIEAGKLEIVETDYSLAKLLKDVVDLVMQRAETKGLELFVKVDETLPTVLNGDINRVRQVMVNILNNAVKYTHEGSVTLSVSGVIKQEEELDLVISVSDTGIGIKEEDKDKLFSSFERLDEKKNTNIEGTGLGLAITWKLVNSMNGNIEVDSVYGKGTTFTITIPQTIIDKEEIGDYKERVEDLRKAKKQVRTVDATGVNILVVDDNLVNLKVMEGLLRPTNANVVPCKSGARCLNMLSKKAFDIVFLDHMMPDMDGIEVLHKAKEIQNGPSKDAIYVALTANAISGIREKYLSEGFDDYLSKPIESAELMTFLDSHIKK